MYALHLDHVRVASRHLCYYNYFYVHVVMRHVCEASRLVDGMGELSPTPAHERPRISVTKIDM